MYVVNLVPRRYISYDGRLNRLKKQETSCNWGQALYQALQNYPTRSYNSLETWINTIFDNHGFKVITARSDFSIDVLGISFNSEADAVAFLLKWL